MSIVKKVWHISNTDKTIDHFIASNKGIFGPGIYTTTNFEKIKKHYFDSKSKRHGGRVYELEVTLQNPIEGNDGILKDGSPYYKLIQAYASEYGGEEGSVMAMEHAKKLGHDGVIRKSTDGTEIVLPFDDISIKIINNNVNMEQYMQNKTPLTEQDFVFNGRKDWKSFVESRYKKKLNENEIIKGGKADGKSLEDIAKHHNVKLEDLKAEYEKGLEVEKEHKKDGGKTVEEIAKDHLFEDPKYYTKLHAAKLEEEKKKTIIRPDGQRAAPAQGSAQLASQAAGPGTTSPAVVAESKQDCTPWKPGCPTEKGQVVVGGAFQYGATPAAAIDATGTVSPSDSGGAIGEAAPKFYPKPEKLHNYPRSENPAKAETIVADPIKTSSPKLAPKDPETSKLIDQLLNAFEQGGLEAIGTDGHDMLLANIEKMSPEQQNRFNEINVMAESREAKKKKKEDLAQIKMAGSTLDRSENKHMPPPKRVEGDKRDKLMKRAERHDESENRSKYFKEAWKRKLEK
jgi:hypothetical protein